MLSSWNYDGKFLTRYPQNTQSTISNLFCHAVRDGMKTVFQVLGEVEYQARRRKGKHNQSYLTDEWLDVLIEHLSDEEAEDFAAFIIERENLTLDEKTKLKEQSGVQYQQQYMAEQPPTDKQLKYLKSLGCETVPETKLEASQLIDQYLKTKGKAA